LNHFFVINPHSFKKAAGKLVSVLSEIDNCFTGKNKAEYKVYLSRYSRDAIAVVFRYIMEAGGDPVRVYAIGGDGILFDCLNGMAHFPNAELTCVPYGNANDFVRAFGEGATNKFRDIMSLTKGTPHAVDIISSGSNFAMQELNIGLIGQTIINAKSMFPKIPISLLRKNTGAAYSICTLTALFNKDFGKQQYTVAIDGEELSGNFMNIHVANVACNGGSQTPSPYAMPNSGLLEVIITDTKSRLKAATVISDYSKGKFEKYDFFIHRKCKKLNVGSDSFLKVEKDGEGFLAQDINIEILPGHVQFVAPSDMEFADFSNKAYNKKKGGES